MTVRRAGLNTAIACAFFYANLAAGCWLLAGAGGGAVEGSAGQWELIPAEDLGT